MAGRFGVSGFSGRHPAARHWGSGGGRLQPLAGLSCSAGPQRSSGYHRHHALGPERSANQGPPGPASRAVFHLPHLGGWALCMGLRLSSGPCVRCLPPVECSTLPTPMTPTFPIVPTSHGHRGCSMLQRRCLRRLRCLQLLMADSSELPSVPCLSGKLIERAAPVAYSSLQFLTAPAA